MCTRPPNHILRLGRRGRMVVVMDLLSAVLRELRFESAAYRWLELGAPFRIGFDQPGLRGVHIIARGQCDIVLDDGTVDRLTAGDLVIFPRGDSHVMRSPGPGTAPRVSGFELAMRTPGGRMRAGGPGSDLVMARLSDALLIRALRHYSDTVERPGWLAGLRDPYVAAALAALHADPARPWTVASIANTAGLSRAAFAARFTHSVGEPVMRYLQSIRMQRAKTLLQNQQATVAAVATQVGYQSDVAFAAAFKREVGSSPGTYRRAATP